MSREKYPRRLKKLNVRDDIAVLRMTVEKLCNSTDDSNLLANCQTINGLVDTIGHLVNLQLDLDKTAVVHSSCGARKTG